MGLLLKMKGRWICTDQQELRDLLLEMGVKKEYKLQANEDEKPDKIEKW